METANDIFTEKIDTLAKELDKLGLYVIDFGMVAVNNGHERITDLESIRRLAIQGQLDLSFDIECIAGKSAWRNPFEFNLSPVEDYFE